MNDAVTEERPLLRRPTVDDLLLHLEVSQFLFREAKLQDEHRYSDWEALWADDGVYWVPANGVEVDPEQEMSIIYDNRSRIALRVRQLNSGKRHAQDPRSGLRRVVSNIEVEAIENSELLVAANALLMESSARGDILWACRNIFRLRRADGELKIVRKTVLMPNNDRALYSMAFLI